MKTIIIAVVACMAICSCKKRVETHIIPEPTTTIVGSWTNDEVDNLKPTFTKDSVTWGYEQPYRYLATMDSIYIIYPSRVVYCEYSYAVSAHNDTLYMRMAPPYDEVLVYWRR